MHHVGHFQSTTPSPLRLLTASLIVCFIGWVSPSPALGQGYRDARNLGAPSPAEMVLRLQYRSQQQTPIFDFLRSSGRDIFSKLGDDERKFAERFAEDLIQKKGLESDEVQELLKRMNVQSDIQEIVRDSLQQQKSGQKSETESGGANSNFDLERLKQRLEKARQNHLRGTPNTRTPRSSTPLDRTPIPTSNFPSDRQNSSGFDAARETSPPRNLPRDSQTATADSRQAKPLNVAPTNTAADRNAAANAAGQPDNPASTANRAPSQRTKFRGDQGFQGELQGQLSDSDLAEATKVPPRQRESSRSSTSPNDLASSKPLLDPNHQRVIDKIKQAIGTDSEIGRETGKRLDKIRQAQDPTELLAELKQLSKQVATSSEQQQLLERAASGLSESDEQLIQSVVGSLNPELADLLRGDRRQPAAPQPASTASRNSRAQTLRAPDRSPSHPVASEDWAQNEFLQQAISYYSNEDSGFKKPQGYDSLLRNAPQGNGSNSSMTMNLKTAKKLWDRGADIFRDDQNESDFSSSQQLKPGQRFDKVLMEAIKEVSEKTPESSNQEKSFFTKALNGLIGQAMTQAKDSAKQRMERQRKERQARWNIGSDREEATGSIIEFDNRDAADANAFFAADKTTGTPQSSPSTASTTAPNQSLAIDLPNFNFNGRVLLYLLLGIIMAACLIYGVAKLFQPQDQVAVKRQTLRQKLQSDQPAKPSDIVDAVDLFLLNRFGSVASWWNANHAANRLRADKPDWYEKIGSVFRLYRWSRYQASSKAEVSVEQKKSVAETLRELELEFDRDAESSAAETPREVSP